MRRKNGRITFLHADLRGSTVAVTGAMRPVRLALALCLAGGLTTSTALAAPITITFDRAIRSAGSARAHPADQYAGVGVTFAPNAFTGRRPPAWATNTNMTIVSSTGADVGALGPPSLVSGNVLRSFNGWLDENGDASFRATFGGGITSLSATFAGILPVPSSTRLFAYNGSTAAGDRHGGHPATGQQVLTVSSAKPITSVVFTPGDFNDWVGVDNITFTPVAVPEPAGLALLALGVAAATRSRAGADASIDCTSRTRRVRSSDSRVVVGPALRARP